MGDQFDAQGNPLGAPPKGPTAANQATGAAGMTMAFQSTNLRFQPPKTFEGKDDQFELWAYKLRAYMALSNPRFRTMMRDAQEATEEVGCQLFDAHEQILAAQLQNVLISSCDGLAA